MPDGFAMIDTLKRNSAMPIADDVTWYAVHSKPGSETLVHHSLLRDGYESLLLRYTAPKKTPHGRVMVVVKPYYPRYLFVGVYPGQGLYRVNKTEGVSTVLYCGDDALEVPAAVIAELRARADKDGFVDTPKQRARRHVASAGEEHRILAGPFQAFMAEIEEDDGGPAIKAWVRMFGRNVRAEFKPEDLGLTPTVEQGR